MLCRIAVHPFIKAAESRVTSSALKEKKISQSECNCHWLSELRGYLSSAEAQRVFFFSGGVDPLSNLSAGTELQATAEGAGASARYHTQDGRHPGETIFSALLSGVACVR